MAIKQVFNTSAELDYPTVLPTLDLDFANSKTLDPRITFTRASGGSYVGPDGLIKYAGVNEARFDHDPVTGESLGLLIEEQRANLISNSENFDTWTKPGTPAGASISQDVTSSPDGNNTADKIVETNTTGGHGIWIGFTLPSTTTYTFSVFLKAAERTWVDVRGFNPTNGNQFIAKIDLINGVFLSNTTGTVRLDEYLNGWWRFSGIGSFNNIYTQFFIAPIISNASASDNSYTGDETSGVFVWGAQVEAGSFPTSYIPTQGSTRTRAADDAVITGKNFSDFYRQDEGTVFVDYKLITNGSSARVFNIDNGTNNIRISCLCGDTFLQTFILPENRGPTITLPSTFNFKITSVHKDYNVLNYINGKYFNFETGKTMIIPKNLNTLRIGNWAVNTFQGTIIKKFTYYPKALQPSQLQSLTS